MDRENRLLPLIALFKVAKACLLFIVAFGFHKLFKGDVSNILLDWMRVIRVDPENGIVHTLVEKITGLKPEQLHHLGIATCFYGMIFLTEGFGLLMKMRWAEYMTVITTTTFLPLEIYELVARPERRIFKAILLLLNLAILGYLVINLIKARYKQA